MENRRCLKDRNPQSSIAVMCGKARHISIHSGSRFSGAMMNLAIGESKRMNPALAACAEPVLGMEDNLCCRAESAVTRE